MTAVYIDDRELLELYATRRSADAFAQIVRRYAGMVYATARRVTGNAADAEDVAQTCFLELARSAGKVRSSVGGWLHATAVTRCATLVMRTSARRQRERARILPEPANDAVWGQIESLVDEAIAKLPQDSRELLVSHYLQGMGQVELAARDGVSQSTISRRIERAVGLVREQLRRAGVEVPAQALGAALATGPVIGGAPESLVASVTKMGISGVGTVRTGVAGWAIAAGVLVCVVAGIAIVTGIAGEGDVPPQAPGVAVQAAPAAEGRRTRANIDGITPGARDTNPYAQGMSILLQHIGHEDADYIRVMGYSGVAFVLQMNLEGPIIDGKYDLAWWPNDSYAFDLRVEFLGRAFGREMRMIPSPPGVNDARQQYIQQFEPEIVQAIDSGMPVLAKSSSAVLITGYDLESHLPTVLWPTPGQPAFGPPSDPTPWGIFAPGKAIEPLKQSEAELQSLTWAIALWDEKAAATAQGWDASQILTGSKAFAAWLEFLQQQKDGVGLGRDAWDNNLMIHLRYNQSAAVTYLRQMAARHPAAADQLNAAADLYEEALEDCNRAPFWGSTQENQRDQGLQDYTDIVRRTMQRYDTAIAHLREAVQTMADAK